VSRFESALRAHELVISERRNRGRVHAIRVVDD